MTKAEGVRKWLERVDVSSPSGCWVWPGAKFRSGYGNVSYVDDDGRRRNGGLHRIVFEVLVGPIPEGHDLDHLCRNPSCCNPAHLEPVTRSENLQRGIGVGGVRANHANTAKTHCKRGHPFDEVNTYRPPSGGRECRTCMRERHAKWRDARQAVCDPNWVVERPEKTGEAA